MSENKEPTRDDLDLAAALHINYCEDLIEDGEPWEVTAEPGPQYFETLKEAIVFLVNLSEPDDPEHPTGSPAPAERKEGHSALRWNKDAKKLETFDPHPPAQVDEYINDHPASGPACSYCGAVLTCLSCGSTTAPSLDSPAEGSEPSEIMPIFQKLADALDKLRPGTGSAIGMLLQMAYEDGKDEQRERAELAELRKQVEKEKL